MKRIISAMLAVLLCVLILGGCGQVQGESPSSKAESGSDPSTEESEGAESSTESEDGEQEEIVVPNTEYVVDGSTVTAKIAVLVNEENEWYYSNISFNGVVEISFEIPEDWELIPLCDEAGVLKQLKFDAEWNDDPDGVANICVYADCGNTYDEHSDYTALLTWKDEYHYFELTTPYTDKASCLNLHYPAYREGDDGWQPVYLSQYTMQFDGYVVGASLFVNFETDEILAESIASRDKFIDSIRVTPIS